MNVLTAAWVGSGCSGVADDPSAARCARCGVRAGVVPTRAAVSKTFTGFDDWAHTSGRHLCECCAWGYSTPGLRASPYLITRDPAGIQGMARHQVGEFLAGGALATDSCVVVPLRPGRKHLLPTAVWGRVCVDDARLIWGPLHAELLRTVFRLRSLGFGSRMLAEPAPSFRVMSSLPASQYAAVLRDWERLSHWREPDNPWLPLAVHITLPTTEGVPS